MATKIKPGDFVRYIGHTEKCPGKDCELLDLPFLIGKITQVISTRMSTELKRQGLMVEYGGNNYGFIETHVELARGSYDDGQRAGVEEGLRIAMEIAEKSCVCVAKDWRLGCCAASIRTAIRDKIKT